MNVFVIMTDSWRYDHIGCCGDPIQSDIKTPGIDTFVAEATLFTNCYSEGLPTLPTRQTLFTGRYTLPFRGWQPLDVAPPVLAEILWSRGFRTALITDTYHLHKPGMLYERGFDDVCFIRGQEEDPHVIEPIDVDVDRYFKDDGGDNERWRNQVIQCLRNRHHWKGQDDHFIAQVVRAGIDWIDRQPRKDRLFLWLDCFDPHEAWDPTPPFDSMYGEPAVDDKTIILPIPRPVEGYLSARECRHIQNLYGGMCSLADWWIGVFLNRLRDIGLFENSLIVFLTDHGEPLGDARWGHGIMRKCRPWPYEELAHIPLIVRHPQYGHGKRVEGLVQTCDVTPTLLDYLGIESPPTMHGKTLLPVIRGEVQEIRELAVSGYHRRSWSIRTNEWTYLRWPAPDQAPTRDAPELYNRRADPYEQVDLIREYPQIADELDLKMRRFVDSL